MKANKKDINTALKGVNMEHRHFSFIARALWGIDPKRNNGVMTDRTEWERLVCHFTNELRGTNARFNSDRFIAACGHEG